MPRSCVAEGCQNRYNKNRPDLPFKTIPKDKKLNELWKIRIKREKYPTDNVINYLLTSNLLSLQNFSYLWHYQILI